MSSSDPLSTGVDSRIHCSLEKPEKGKMPPHCSRLGKDSNENEQVQCNFEDRGEKEKKYDFLVWHGPCNKGQADRIYTELEGKGLCGYIHERDGALGQYKLTAMDEAIKNTANIILLLSEEAQACQDFNRKMHATITSSQNSIIPIYVGKMKRPALLRHHVDIQYKDDESLWVRLHNSITRPKKTIEKTKDKVGSPKPLKRDSRPTNSSQAPSNQSSRPITVVPSPNRLPRSQTKPEKKSEVKGGWWFSRKKKVPEEPQGIPMKPVSTRRKENRSASTQ